MLNCGWAGENWVAKVQKSRIGSQQMFILSPPLGNGYFWVFDVYALMYNGVLAVYNNATKKYKL